MVPREMEITATPRRLAMQIAEIEHVIGPDQHMQHVGPMGHGCQPVELIGGLVGCRDLHKMLGFIDDHRLHLEARHGLFDGLTQIQPLRHVACHACGLGCRGDVDQEFFDDDMGLEGRSHLSVVIQAHRGARI